MSATNLPPEIIEAILPLLPAKSLGRFKSVSKTWNSLISNPQFIKTHLRQTINHHKTTKFIFFSDTISLYSLDINQLLTDDLSTTPRELSSRTPPITWARIIGSCNGLVLAQEDETDAIFILNPTTKQLHKVPSSPFTQPDEESSDIGFGYDSSTDDYKVVSISFWDDYPDIFVCVYSLLNNSWRKLHNFPYNVVVHTLMNGILVNENLHWLARTNLEHPPQLVAFNLATEEFNEVKLPDDDKFKFMFKELVAVGGKLCLVDTQMVNSIFWVVGGNIGVCNIGQIDDTDLWIMEEYGVCDSWTKVCIHGVEIDPVCLVDGSNREIVLCDEQEVVVYNTKERRCENVRGLSGVLAVEGTYFESLESPKRISRAP